MSDMERMAQSVEVHHLTATLWVASIEGGMSDAGIRFPSSVMRAVELVRGMDLSPSDLAGYLRRLAPIVEGA